jgi:hypothetical protein
LLWICLVLRSVLIFLALFPSLFSPIRQN